MTLAYVVAIIKAVTSNPLGIVALVILILSGLALKYFPPSSSKRLGTHLPNWIVFFVLTSTFVALAWRVTAQARNTVAEQVLLSKNIQVWHSSDSNDLKRAREAENELRQMGARVRLVEAKYGTFILKDHPVNPANKVYFIYDAFTSEQESLVLNIAGKDFSGGEATFAPSGNPNGFHAFIYFTKMTNWQGSTAM